MAALAAQKFIHPREHIYQLKWVSKDHSLELIYRYTSRHRDTSFNDIILTGQEHFCYCSQDQDIFILFVRREALLCMHLASGTVSWRYCQEHIIFATEATLGEWCASPVLTGVHKRFSSRHTENLSQTVWCRCVEWPQEPCAALLCPQAGGSCAGLPVPASTGADWPSSTSKKTKVPMRVHALSSQGTLWKRLWTRCKNALFGCNIFFHSPGDHEPQADWGSAAQAADSAVHHLTSKSHS